MISNNALSFTQSNGKTLESFIKGWDRDSVAQLYFRDEAPVSDVCGNFYRITDSDMLKSCLGITKINKGAEDPSCNRLENRLVAKTKSWNISRLAREAVWTCGRWRQQSLLAWLDSFKPEVIFFCGGDSAFAYDITRAIAERYAAGIIFYITDDHVTRKFSLSVFYMIRYLIIKRKFSEMIGKCHEFITIGEKMSAEYFRRFGRKSTVAMNSIEIPEYAYKKSSGAVRFVYMGGLHYNRWKTLTALAGAIDKINASGMEACLEIYSSGTVGDKMTKMLNRPAACRFMGSLDKEGTRLKMAEADVLVHVESFDRKSRHSTRLSVSTKIPEYMAASRCVLGIGPEEVASIEYLKGFAYVITEKNNEEIYKKLLILLNDPCLMESLAASAYNTAKMNHDINDIRKRIYDMSVKMIKQV